MSFTVAQKLPELHNNYVPESMVQVTFDVGDVGNEYKRSRYMHIQGSPVENQTSAPRNPIYRSKTAQLPVIPQQ